MSQPSGAAVSLVTAKSRLAKQGLSIPRLELVSGHMAANLIFRGIPSGGAALLARQHRCAPLDPWNQGVQTVCQ